MLMENTTLRPIFTQAVKEFTSTAGRKRMLIQAESQVKDFSCSWAHNLRENTAQIPFPESSPHPHLTWRQEEENHEVSERLLAAGVSDRRTMI